MIQNVFYEFNHLINSNFNTDFFRNVEVSSQLSNLNLIFVGSTLLFFFSFFSLLAMIKYLIFFFFSLIFDKIILSYHLLPKTNTQQFMEFLVVSFQKVVKQNFGHHYPYKSHLFSFYPLFLVFFLLILVSNFLGLVPFVIRSLL